MVSAECREVRRRLGPLRWTVLEDLALDAHPDDAGGFWARTSARRVAGHLGIEAGTAANALRRLRAEGLVTLAREPGPAGRFGCSVYRWAPIPGLTITDQSVPCVDSPPMVEPARVRPATVKPAAVEPAAVGPSAGRPDAGPQLTAEESVRGRRAKGLPRAEALTLWDTPGVG